MGLYLCVFSELDELEGVEVGRYDDFAFFRRLVTSRLESGDDGSRYPTLINHSDCDGEWSPAEARLLKSELLEIKERLGAEPPADFNSDWQREVAKLVGLRPQTLAECFIDTDGEPLIERLLELADVAIRHELPIIFQ
ncbi:MAG: hypothetical protein KC731_42375 [Myxococcales bacterium]|nr:hypothetical protein [Myxococcales bacterium]